MDQNTQVAAAAYFAAETAALTLVVSTDDGFAVITRTGRIIPVQSAEEADRVSVLAAEREARG